VPPEPIIAITYSRSTKVVIAGDDVTYTCTVGKAKPIARLRFSYTDGHIKSSELTRKPETSSINFQKEGNSTLIWRAKATSDMHGKFLKCSIFDHLSQTQKYDEIEMIVYCKCCIY